MLEFWNQRYRETAYAYGTRPNDFLAQELGRLSPGRLLLPAEGEGRNAVYAAEAGWAVTALDYSEAGRDKALALAAERGVTIQYSLADLATLALEPESFDAAGLVFAHLPPPVRAHLHAQVAAALRPGGWLILEAFGPGQIGRSSGGPQQLPLLYDLDTLRADFAGLSWVRGETCIRHLDEGPYHQGEAAVVQVLLQKPH